MKRSRLAAGFGIAASLAALAAMQINRSVPEKIDATAALKQYEPPAPESEPPPFRMIGRAEDRRLNAEFERAALSIIRRNGDHFVCLRLMPYDAVMWPCDLAMFVPNWDQKAGHYLSAQLNHDAVSFFGQEWHDVLQLCLAAHEFKHYLNYKNGRYQIYDDMAEGSPEFTTAKRLNELSGDTYCLAVVRAIYPERAAEFARRLQEYRGITFLMGDVQNHEDIAVFELTGLDNISPRRTKDPLILSQQTDRMMDGFLRRFLAHEDAVGAALQRFVESDNQEDAAALQRLLVNPVPRDVYTMAFR